ncbi:MAG: VacJ family lipoprotein [Alphaproteobacteria bacterium]|nr:VacJ family lipoprotein [Alphaproteobacteria bacterium]
MNKLIQTILTLLFISLIPNLIFAAASDEVKTSSEDFETTTFEDEIYDPLEGVNRAIFSFNNVADKIVLEPVAKGYKKLPSPIQSGVGNFVNNLKLPLAALNQLLQGQGKNAAESTGRFLVNSTIGVFGLIDVAENIGLDQKEEDFGQTLATWGVGDGFYIVLPLFGPSNLRDTTGMVMTMMTDPINAYAVTQGEAWAIPVRTAANAIDQRSQIIDEVNALRDNSVDYYAAVRSSYYQNRKAAIMNTDDDVLTPLPLISIEFE